MKPPPIALTTASAAAATVACAAVNPTPRPEAARNSASLMRISSRWRLESSSSLACSRSFDVDGMIVLPCGACPEWVAKGIRPPQECQRNSRLDPRSSGADVRNARRRSWAIAFYRDLTGGRKTLVSLAPRPRAWGAQGRDASSLHVPVEEARDLLEGFARLRRIRVDRILRVREPFEHLQVGLDAGAPQLAMGAYGQAEEKVARARGQDGGRKAGEVAVD